MATLVTRLTAIGEVQGAIDDEAEVPGKLSLRVLRLRFGGGVPDELRRRRVLVAAIFDFACGRSDMTISISSAEVYGPLQPLPEESC